MCRCELAAVVGERVGATVGVLVGKGVLIFYFKMSKSDKVYLGVCNPKGAALGEETTYMDEGQLGHVAETMKGLPVYIEHFRQLQDGRTIPACGVVEGGFVHPKSKELWVAFSLNEEPIGQLAKSYLGEEVALKELPFPGVFPNAISTEMSELSLGYDIAFKETEDGRQVPSAHRINELSICQKGAREGTHIKGEVDTKTGAVKKFEKKPRQKEQPPQVQKRGPLGLADIPNEIEKIYKILKGEPDLKKRKLL